MLIGPLDPVFAVYPEPHRRAFFEGEPPSNETERRDYARRLMKRVSDRAFRRPVADDALAELTEIVMSATTFEQGVAQGLMAVLSSPNFLYRAELQPTPNDPKVVHLIDEHALASRLSSLLRLFKPMRLGSQVLP